MGDLFQTKSLNMVAWLLTKNIKYTQRIMISGKYTFLYERTPELLIALDQYDRNIELKEFITKFREVKESLKV